ncbi:uncharacterized protein BJX67DRAFT_62108 [Aspergillus lucknowensis]|uniref:F-box domain-containing protein n=1 Tax=Aspergillus lucknowensis TaxID=176173 RepID=A0ABR4LUD8_9EURO
MTETRLHNIFCNPKILEAILLHLDMLTLLTSAQQVCRRWRDLIQKSDDLQIALFLKPSKEKVTGKVTCQRNPLIETIIWPEYFRKRLNSSLHRRNWNYEDLNLPTLDPSREAAFLRPEASWRRMLISQPPKFGVFLLETSDFRKPSPLLSLVRVECEERGWPVGVLSIGRLEGLVNIDHRMPGRDTLFFWPSTESVKCMEYMLLDTIKGRLRKYNKNLAEAVFIENNVTSLWNPIWPMGGVDKWIKENGGFRIYREIYRQPIWGEGMGKNTLTIPKPS